MRTTKIATLAAIAVAGLSSPAQAGFDTVGGLSSGPKKPQVAWDHAAWKKCWTLSYKQAREDGFTPNASTAYADLVCGDPPA